MTRLRNEVIAKQRAAIPKGLKCKQTLTSLMRKDVSKQVADQFLNRSPNGSTTTEKRTQSLYRVQKPTKVLPPLQHVPGSRNGFNNPRLHSSQHGTAIDLPNQNEMDVKSNTITPKPINQERVLYPTENKDTFLQRNKHVAHARMEQMAVDIAAFAKRSGVQHHATYQ